MLRLLLDEALPLGAPGCLGRTSFALALLAAKAAPVAAVAAATTLASGDGCVFNAAMGSRLGALLLLAAVGGKASRLSNGAEAGALAVGATSMATTAALAGAEGGKLLVAT